MNIFVRRSLKMLPGMLAAIVLIACEKVEPPKVEPVTVKTLSQQSQEIAERLRTQMAANEAISLRQSEAAERARFVRLIREKIDRWARLDQQLVGKRAHELDDIISKLRSIRSELLSTSTTLCTEPLRDATAANMSTVINLLEDFKAKNGVVVANFSDLLGEQSIKIQFNNSELSSCL